MNQKSPLFTKLLKYAKQYGIIIRRESGRFSSGYCTANGANIIILNSKAREKTMCEIIVLALYYFKFPIPDDKDIAAFCNNELQNSSENDFEIDLTENETVKNEKEIEK